MSLLFFAGAAPLMADKDGKLGTLVVVGDSLSAGFQNFSLIDNPDPAAPQGQTNGFASLISAQAGGKKLILPLISPPGLPAELSLGGSNQYGPIILRNTNTGNGMRSNPSVQAYNLSVPAFTVANALSYEAIPANATTDPVDALALSVLATPGTTQNPPCALAGVGVTGHLFLSEVECAIKLHPDTIIASIGANDALQSLTFGLPPTPSWQFGLSYAVFLGALSSTGANIVVSNIPDVTSLPFLVPAAAFEHVCQITPPKGLGPNDFVVPDLTNATKIDVSICGNYAIRSASLVAQAQAAVVSYNATIAELAPIFGATVVDLNGLFKQIAANGVKTNGECLSTSFLGGLFSLDGIHPTNTGYAIVANQFIAAMNSHLHTGMDPVNVAQIAGGDPLIIRDIVSHNTCH